MMYFDKTVVNIMAEYLFIGGDQDGLIYDVSDDIVCMPIVNGDKLSCENYIKTAIRGQDDMICVYVIENMTTDKLFEALIMKYHCCSNMQRIANNPSLFKNRLVEVNQIFVEKGANSIG